ncbi:hypothetical protein [Limosilactobacillus sp.]|jgi:hypothetical protein|uniref:hypothetical protein n=1 Tax=Limosilactobacillus sp. TaxID=2773925 RepID=UPI00345EDEF9
MINSQLDIFDLKRLQIPQSKHELVEGGESNCKQQFRVHNWQLSHRLTVIPLPPSD